MVADALGLARDETTWMVLHYAAAREGRPGRDRLRGPVEVDETYVGGDENDVHWRDVAAGQRRPRLHTR